MKLWCLSRRGGRIGQQWRRREDGRIRRPRLSQPGRRKPGFEIVQPVDAPEPFAIEMVGRGEVVPPGLSCRGASSLGRVGIAARLGALPFARPEPVPDGGCLRREVCGLDQPGERRFSDLQPALGRLSAGVGKIETRLRGEACGIEP